MVEMGFLQLGLPVPSMLPWDWPLAVIDIKDCFFSVLLHPRDAPRFVLSSISREVPLWHYHWTVFAQGMGNRCTVCQWYIADMLSRVRWAFFHVTVLHYMDDVLVRAPLPSDLKKTLEATVNVIKVAGMNVNNEKIQRTYPW